MRIILFLAFVGSWTAAYGADFAMYIGDQYPYQVAAVATDANGNTYVTGARIIPIPGFPNALSDVFVTKLDAGGNIVFTTTFGGKGLDQGNAIAVDSAGNIWVGGSTSSDNFPLRGAIQIELGGGNPGGESGFLVKLAPDGTVVYSSYFGGAQGISSVNGVATDAGGNVYLTGTTDSPDFPTTPGLPAGMVNSTGVYVTSGAFVSKLDPTGSKILYSALLAGAAVDCSGGSSCFLMDRSTGGVGIGVDGAGEAFITGNTNTVDLPVTPGGMPGLGAFAAKVNTAGNQLAYLTYLGPPGGMDVVDYGPSETINASAIAVDAAGDAYLTGSTNDANFPATAGAFQTTLNGTGNNAFAMKLDSSGGVAWATLFNEPGSNSIGIDSSGDVWLTGSAGFPNGALFLTEFLAELSADGSKLLSSMTQAFAGQSLAVDSSGILHLSSENGLISTITPGAAPTPHITGIMNAAQGEYSGRIAPGEIISIFGYAIGPAAPASAVPQNGQFPASLGSVQVLVNGTAIPLIYVSASQINAEIPAPLTDLDENDTVAIQVVNGSSMLPDFRAAVDQTIFGIFLNPDGTVAAINQDGTLNSKANPAQPGSFVSIWATGFNPLLVTMNGSISTAANDWCDGCSITVGGVSETVADAGAAPSLIDGVMQINFLIPIGPWPSNPTTFPVNFNGFGTQGEIWIQ